MVPFLWEPFREQTSFSVVNKDNNTPLHLGRGRAILAWWNYYVVNKLLQGKSSPCHCWIEACQPHCYGVEVGGAEFGAEAGAEIPDW